MFQQSKSVFHVAPNCQPIFRELGIDGNEIFRNPLIKPWRILRERENCTLDATLADGRVIRWHVKRHQAVNGVTTPAEEEVEGHRLLVEAQIPTAELVGWGRLTDGRSFVIFDDLAGYQPGDKVIQGGVSFEQILEPTADLTARLHAAGLHHRDLYLCHFFINLDEPAVRLIDAARVRKLPGLLARGRWIVKDLAQFWYSTIELGISDELRERWFARYAQQRGLRWTGWLRQRIKRKAAWIARHDVELRRRQPTRNISIPAQ